MARQTTRGKGFEYACLLALYERLSIDQEVVIEESPPLYQARTAYKSLDQTTQTGMGLGARAAIRALCRLEPQLENPGKNTPLILKIQSDQQGAAGDVRDILTIRRQNNWEIGISAKHNHAAVKHSRLSNTIDFGSSWFGTPCSADYFEEIQPLFEELAELQKWSVKWSDVSNKAERFYVPILEAFIAEIKRLYTIHGETIPQELLRYLLGRNDFYKLITNTRNRVSKLQAFSFCGTLNRAAGKVKPQYRVPNLRLPTVIHDIDFKPRSRTTINIVCNEGWQLAARIHNASSYVEPSLKFDITLVGLPPSVYSHDEPWDFHEGLEGDDSNNLAAERERK